MTKLILLIGLPGSGKSTLAKKLIAESPQMQLISTDAIRGQLFGAEAIQGSWLLIWQEIERQFRQATTANISTIFDATNAQRKNRREIIELAREIGFTHITGIWIKTPVWVCLKRNQNRDRQVPEEVILRMHRQLRDAPPSLNDGIDEIIYWGDGVISNQKSKLITSALMTNDQCP
ncbi:AAA family ATPase [Okeanomitos corallinicola TIOX110]|uniref:AAA family ATPase n=1 Tax=Okeanomitos corallinicola TIOX110 TaxID=3133117 RepID=A0ABZ2UPL8_9CYAN